MSKFCTDCGALLENNAAFCYKCGKGQSGEAESQSNLDFAARQRLQALMPQMGMKWHKINIGVLIFSIVMAFSSAVNLISGAQFSNKAAAYDSGMEAFEGLCGVGVMVAVVIAIVAVLKLKKLNAGGLGLQMVAYGIFAGANVVNALGVMNYPNIYGDSDISNPMFGIVYCLVLIICNHVYYSKRLHMFT